MKRAVLVLACVASCVLAQEASAAVKYKRFPHCAPGLVSAKTCECHAGTSGKYNFCHAGHYCHVDGTCAQ